MEPYTYGEALAACVMVLERAEARIEDGSADRDSFIKLKLLTGLKAQILKGLALGHIARGDAIPPHLLIEEAKDGCC